MDKNAQHMVYCVFNMQITFFSVRIPPKHIIFLCYTKSPALCESFTWKNVLIEWLLQINVRARNGKTIKVHYNDELYVFLPCNVSN